MDNSKIDYTVNIGFTEEQAREINKIFELENKELIKKYKKLGYLDNQLSDIIEIGYNKMEV